MAVDPNALTPPPPADPTTPPAEGSLDHVAVQARKVEMALGKWERRFILLEKHWATTKDVALVIVVVITALVLTVYCLTGNPPQLVQYILSGLIGSILTLITHVPGGGQMGNPMGGMGMGGYSSYGSPYGGGGYSSGYGSTSPYGQSYGAYSGTGAYPSATVYPSVTPSSSDPYSTPNAATVTAAGTDTTTPTSTK